MKLSLKLTASIIALSAASSALACPSHPNVFDSATIEPVTGKKVCILNGELETEDPETGSINPILSSLTLENQYTWLLNGRVQVGTSTDYGATGPVSIIDQGITLTIEPGTTILGDNTAAATYFSQPGAPTKYGLDYLVINRGADIQANGNANQPIIMTSIQDLSGNGIPSQWGGLYINGYAPTNHCEGDPSGTVDTDCGFDGEANTGRYGGPLTTDNSGSVKYLVLSFAGFINSASSELNGIALQGVGSGTTFDYIQIHAGSDDGIEFFGGNAQVKHLVLTDNQDDSFDVTGGWQGKAQYVIAYHSGGQPVDRLFENDTWEFGHNFIPQSTGQVANATLISATASTSDLIKSRNGSDMDYFNFVFVDTNNNDCLDQDDASPGGALNPDLQSALLSCNNLGNVATWTTVNVDTTTVSQANSLDGYVNGAIENGFATVDLSGDTFFDNVGYIGAVEKL